MKQSYVSQPSSPGASLLRGLPRLRASGPFAWNAAPRWSLELAGSLLLVILVTGCTSNRFQLANARTQTPGGDGYAYGAPRVRVPAAPTPVLAPAPGELAAANASQPPLEAATAVQAVPVVVQPTIAPPPQSALAVNPNPNNTGIMNRRRLTTTPRPGAPGSRLDMAADGPELVGRVVNPFGRAEPHASVRVLDVSQGNRVAAEVASGADGGFRVINLRPGVQYELMAIGSSSGQRLTGSTIAVPPDTAVVIQVTGNNPAAQSGADPRFGALASNGRDRWTPTPIPSPQSRTGVTLRDVQPSNYDPARDYRSAPARLPGSVTVNTPPMLAQALSAYVAPTPQPPVAASRAPAPPRLQAPAAPPPAAPALATRPAAVVQPAPLPATAPPRAMELAAAPRFDAAASAPRVAFYGTGLERQRLLTTRGEARELGELDGDLILLDFFGSWCGPCRRCVPKLNRLHRQYSSSGLRLIGVACESGDASEAAGQAEDARQQLAIEYAVLASKLDEECPVRRHFGVSRYPTLVLLNRRGDILFQGSGGDEATFHRLEAAIQKSLSRDVALAP